MGPFVRLALRNTRRHWRYTMSSTLAIAVGLMSLWLFRGYMHGVGRMYRDFFQARTMLGDVLIESTRPQGGDPLQSALSPEEQESIEALLSSQPGIMTRVRFLPIEGQIFLGHAISMFSGLAYDVKEGHILRREKWGWNAVFGQPLGAAGQVIVGRGLAKGLGCQEKGDSHLRRDDAGSAYVPEVRNIRCQDLESKTPKSMIEVMTESGQLNAKHFDWSGVMDAGFADIDRTWLMMGLSDGQALLNTQKVGWYSVGFQLGVDQDFIIKSLEQQAAQQKLSVRITRWDRHEFTDLYRRTMSLLGVFEIFVNLILTGIIGVIVFNLMQKSVQERQREVGLFRSLGYRPFHLQKLFLYETTLSAIVGVLGGTGLSFLLETVISRLGITYKAGILSEPVPFAIDLVFALWVQGAAGFVALGLVVTFFAVRTRVRKPIIECLSSP